MLSSLILSCALLPQVPAEPLHPAFTLKRDSFDVIWSKAYAEGQKKHSPKKAIGLALRQIDSYHVSILSKAGCSWAYLIHPRLLVFMAAHTAAKQDWATTEVEKSKSELRSLADSDLKYAGFFVEINEMPSFAGGYGKISRYADPTNLTDVRCVLRVGDRIIQPVQQPGDLTVSKTDEISFFSIPSITYVRGTTNSSATAYSSGGYTTATGYGTSSYAVTSFNGGQQPYSTYRGQFTVLFPLRSPEGKPLITPADKEITLLVIKKSAELKAKYTLNDWTKALE